MKSVPRVIDFSIASIDHRCSGVGDYQELDRAGAELALSVSQMKAIFIWSFLSDLLRQNMGKQCFIVTIFVLFSFNLQRSAYF